MKAIAEQLTRETIEGLQALRVLYEQKVQADKKNLILHQSSVDAIRAELHRRMREAYLQQQGEAQS